MGKPFRFCVMVDSYRLSPRVDGNDRVMVFMRHHHSAAAAGRTLATIIAGRSLLARDVRDHIPRDYAGCFVIHDSANGAILALTPFRAAHGLLRGGRGGV